MNNKITIPITRLVPGLIIGPASWLGPYIVMNSLFLPAMLQTLDPENKIQLVALFASMGMIVAAVSNMVAGALSDRTHSRFGSRTPWIMFGAFCFMASMIGASFATGIPMLLACWMVGQAALNFIVAPMIAWLDFAPEKYKGTASSAYGGLGMALGNNGFNVVGALFLSQFRLGFIIFGVVAFIGTLIAVLIVHEPSNKDAKEAEPVDAAPKQTLSLAALRHVFHGWSTGRDYYLAFIGKMFQGIGNFAIMGYLLYIMTDFLKLGDATASSIQLINTIMLIFGILMGFFAGPFCDKFKVLKYPVAFSTIFLALGAAALFVCRDTTGIVLYGLLAGLGMGLWNSLDNLLNLRVIPDPDRVAFFLGVYNLGNTLTQAIAPVIAAAVISLFGFSSIFLVSFAFAVIGGCCMFAIRKVQR